MGEYVVHFATSMADSNYAVIGTPDYLNVATGFAAGYHNVMIGGSPIDNSRAYISAVHTGVGYNDIKTASVIAFGY